MRRYVNRPKRRGLKLCSLSFLEFIKFVSQQEECRKKWLVAENEAVRLKQEIARITVSFAWVCKRTINSVSFRSCFSVALNYTQPKFSPKNLFSGWERSTWSETETCKVFRQKWQSFGRFEIEEFLILAVCLP